MTSMIAIIRCTDAGERCAGSRKNARCSRLLYEAEGLRIVTLITCKLFCTERPIYFALEQGRGATEAVHADRQEGGCSIPADADHRCLCKAFYFYASACQLLLHFISFERDG